MAVSNVNETAVYTNIDAHWYPPLVCDVDLETLIYQ